ncbi:MAG: bifunctional molybdenum cofactor biosynthesis protein MoaC/MoaB [Ignavibacteriales bacterium]|nr:bifunctional molybdenum cofactor biosynthesis protein MoaC/MoaB [Ignavibacteriales bacterium]
MRDVTNKIKTLRTAIAKATLKVSPATIQLMQENKIPKGDPFPVAKVAAIQAAKNTSQIIPYCHPLPIDFVDCRFDVGNELIEITVEVKAVYKTGVEMEALTAAAVAALTIYDMAKQVDESMEILGVQLIRKKGGKSDFKETFEQPLRVAVLVLSDSIAAGKNEDLSGKLIEEKLKLLGMEIAEYKILPDDLEEIKKNLIRYADENTLDLVLTTGGTGIGPRDVTPEATLQVIERELEGVVESLRQYGQERTPFSMLSRGKAGIRGKTIIVNLPGSQQGVSDALDVLFPSLLHAFKMLWGGGH